MITLANENITLREFTADDKYSLAELADNPKISINLRNGFPNPYAVADAEYFLEKYSGQKSSLVMAIEFEGVYVGNIGLQKQPMCTGNQPKIRYFLGESYWNLGKMT